MSDDVDFDMEVVEDDELDELGAGGASSSDECSKTEKRASASERESSNLGGSNREPKRSQSFEQAATDKTAPTINPEVEGWSRTSLGNFASFQNGNAFSKSDWGEEGYPIIRIQNLTGEADEYNYYDGELEKRYRVDPEDTLLTWSGTIGVFKWEGPPAALNQHIFNVETQGEVNDSFFHFKLEELIPQLEALSHGSTMKHVRKADLVNIDVELPPLPEQRKIASVLYAVDQAIQKTEAIIEQAKRAKRGVMQDLLLRSRSSSGEVEGSWQQLGEVTEWKSGSTPSKGNDAYWGGAIPWVSAKDMKEVKLNGAEDHLTPEGVEEFGTLAPRGSLLVLVRGMRLKDSFPVCLAEEEVAFNQDVKALTPREGVDGEFLAYWLKANENRILGLVTSASHGTKRLGTGSLKNFRVWIPPEEYQRETVYIFQAFDQKIQGERAHRNRLHQLKKGLMQDLLTGEVRTADKAIEVLDEVAVHG